MSANELTIKVAQWFLETPYVEKTLELPGAEKLVINLTGLDCTTFLETVVTLVRMTEKEEFTFEDFEKELEFLRYRDGIKEAYPSRLHYFSDWVYENQQKGILTDITEEIGGSPYPNAPSFMSENPQFYAQLADPSNLEAIKTAEADIKTRSYFYIPKSEISSLEKGIRSGDLIAITTSMDNLDIVHTGFAIQKDGRIHLLHASSKNMEVEISEKTLSDYLAGNKTQSGILVMRLTEN
ncbi:N-acetylmuramoyl-L-alanine amidase-like domain-containing protein [Algoriphagus chordae]|uniref:N-acetylmuramoyl-L-alanine amidase-like domain-containing protein n=1 Tax=Algoriphagus chordae TaxID=237019 RepID=UPI001FEA0C5D|nr:N-acetylmuramoyl-L-alanine amidase-like domain-containing protein [Algoriphagus chordae]